MINYSDIREGNWITVQHAPKGITTFHPVTRKEEMTLRLGNWEQVTDNVIGQDREYNDEALSPIDLTLNLIKKAGFSETYSGSDVYKLNGDHNFVIKKYDDHFLVCIHTGQIDENKGTTVRYLHELQNECHDHGTTLSIQL